MGKRQMKGKQARELKVGDCVWYPSRLIVNRSSQWRKTNPGTFEGTVKEVKDMGTGDLLIVFTFNRKLLVPGSFVFELTQAREDNTKLQQLGKPTTFKGISIE